MTIIGGNDEIVNVERLCYQRPNVVAKLLLEAGIEVIMCGSCHGRGKDPACLRDSRNDICGSCSGRGFVLNLPQPEKGENP